MKYHIRVLDIKRRRNFVKAEVAKNVLKFLGTTSITAKAKHLLFVKFLKGNNILRSSVSFIHNRCVITRRPRAIFRLFRMSRIQIKQMGAYGQISGLKKAS